jgi:putative ATPase
MHYDGEDAAQKGQNYLYPHNYPNHWVEQQYLPDALVGTVYYTPGPNKAEQAAAQYWNAVKHGKKQRDPAE